LHFRMSKNLFYIFQNQLQFSHFQLNYRNHAEYKAYYQNPGGCTVQAFEL